MALNKSLIAGVVASCAIAVGFLIYPLTHSKHSIPNDRVKPKDGEYIQNGQGLWLYTKKWLPTTEYKGVVFLVHGLAEHLHRYDHLAEAFNKEGYAVYSLDLQGHGRSEGDRTFVEEYDHYVDDVETFINASLPSIKEGTPLFLLGHSNGGTISILLAQRRPTLFKGVVLSGPAIIPDPSIATPFLISVAGYLSSWVPKLGAFSLDNAALSRDPNVAMKAKEDPYHYKGSITSRYGYVALKTLEKLREIIPSVEWPFVVLHGTADRLTLHEGSKLLHEKAKSKDKTIILLDDHFHEIFNEIEKEKVIEQVINWIKQRT